MSDQRLVKSERREDDARLLHAAARERLSVAVADLALPQRLRLTDQQRTTITDLLAKLIRTIEDDLRADLAEAEVVRGIDTLAAAFTSAHVAIAGPIIERSKLLSDVGLVSALVRRTEEHLRLRARTATDMSLLVELMRDEDPVIAEQAMAILIGQSRRLDAFSEPAAVRTELPAELQHRLAWRVAAALREYMITVHGADPAAADEEIVAATERLLASYDEGDTLDARAMRLVQRLHDSGRLTDGFIERTLPEGSLSLFLAALAVRTGIGQACAWETLSDPIGRGPVFLLKAAGLDRASAASILLALAGSEEPVFAQVDLFEVTEPATAHQALRLWKIDPGYREAIAELSA